MLTFKRTILILTCFLMTGCIGPFYNPYPLSKLVAKVGPPLKLNTMSVEEQINAEIQAEAKTESSDETSHCFVWLKELQRVYLSITHAVYLWIPQNCSIPKQKHEERDRSSTNDRGCYLLSVSLQARSDNRSVSRQRKESLGMNNSAIKEKGHYYLHDVVVDEG